MKLLVPVKRVIDPYVTIQIDKATGQVKTDNVKMAMNPFDEIALEAAIRLKESGAAGEVQITAITIGCKACQEILRHGLALGADSAIHVAAENTIQPLTVAKILTKIVQDEAVDCVIMGKQAIDGDHNQTGQMLAAMLDWPQACFASSLQLDNQQLTVLREIDGGLETVTCHLPAVITADLRLNEPRYASLPNIMKAKSKPMVELTQESLGLNLTEDLTLLSVAGPPARKAGILVPDAASLVSHLQQEQVI